LALVDCDDDRCSRSDLLLEVCTGVHAKVCLWIESQDANNVSDVSDFAAIESLSNKIYFVFQKHFAWWKFENFAWPQLCTIPSDALCDDVFGCQDSL
jgi:hypothetical protein